jgi:hypothetical protein
MQTRAGDRPERRRDHVLVTAVRDIAQQQDVAEPGGGYLSYSGPEQVVGG